MFPEVLITQFKTLLNEATTIGICGHRDPDGDCLGAALGLGTYLQNHGKSIRYFVPSKISCIFSFLPEISTFQEHIPSNYHPDLRISVDTSNVERSSLSVLSTTTPIINIDHHPTANQRGTVHLINDQISSSCEIIAYLLKDHLLWEITPRIATFLFMGISTDTGHFQRGKDLATTYALTSYLIEQWADFPLVINNLYRNNNFDGIVYVGKLLQDLHKEDGLIRVFVNQTELEKNNLDEAKIETLLQMMTSINHDGIFLLFKWYPNASTPYLKCSLRTKNPSLDLNTIAQQFGWGGHRMAAACRVDTNDVEKSQQEILDFCKRATSDLQLAISH